MALNDYMAIGGDEMDSRFKSRRGAWFDWTMDEEEPQQNNDKLGDCDIKQTNSDSCINWADPRAWQDARKMVSSKDNESKASAQVACKQEVAENYDASDDAVSSTPSPKRERRKELRKQSAEAQRVVWCHEHCHKSHNDIWRKTLWRISRENEASLVCHKKAAKFEAWLSSAAQPNYILISDWREAKPCMDVVSKGFKFAQMIVYCEMETTFRKALEWARNLPLEAGPVQVVNGMEEVEANLVSLFAKASKDEGEVCRTPSTTSECDSDWQASKMDAETSDQSEDEATLPALVTSSIPTVGQVWLQCMPVVTVPVIQVVAPALNHNPIVDVLGPVLSSYSAQDLGQALAAAMPDCYDD